MSEHQAEPSPAEAGGNDGRSVDLWEALSQVLDPELHYDIVNLGLVYGAELRESTARIRMTLTSPSCPYGPYLLHEVRQKLRAVPGVEREEIELVWDPPWGPHLMSEEARLELGFDV
jgi:metal-sulfur cluster biosynthetic enzyme